MGGRGPVRRAMAFTTGINARYTNGIGRNTTAVASALTPRRPWNARLLTNNIP